MYSASYMSQYSVVRFIFASGYSRPNPKFSSGDSSSVQISEGRTKFNATKPGYWKKIRLSWWSCRTKSSVVSIVG